MNVLAPWGFYGSGNIGDDATLQGFGRLVAQSKRPIRVRAGSRRPQHSARVEPSFRYFYHPSREWKRLWRICRTSAIVMPGGTPIMDCHGTWPLDEVVPLLEEAHRWGKPVAFVGSGTERLTRDDSRRVLGTRLAPLVRYWTVRSPSDEARLLEYGVPSDRVRVAADMAWLLEPVLPDWGADQLRRWRVDRRRRLVAVNLMNEKPVLARYPRLFEIVGRFLDVLVDKHDVSVLFLANDVHQTDGFDRSAALQTMAAMTHASRAFLAPNEYWPPQRMMSLIANCDVTMSMRYHFCLFSAVQHVPFIALKRSDKVTDLCSDLEWPFGTGFDDLTVDKLVEIFEGIELRRAEAVEQFHRAIPGLRQRAARNLSALESLQ